MPTIHENAGDAIRGHKIAVKAKKIRLGRVTSGSSRHQIQTLDLGDQVFCIIEIPLAVSGK